MSCLKRTIIKKLQSNYPNMDIRENPVVKTKESTTRKLLCIDSVDKKSIKVIDYESYIKYGNESIDKTAIEKQTQVKINNKNYLVDNYDYENGILVLNEDVDGLLYYNDIVEIGENSVDSDFMICYAPYTYSKTLNKTLVEYYTRFYIDIFIFDDVNETKVSSYSKNISKLFHRAFLLLDDENKTTKNVAYMVNELTFNVLEYNITNKILRGSMLIKTYSYE